jgi:hypothetical protein
VKRNQIELDLNNFRGALRHFWLLAPLSGLFLTRSSIIGGKPIWQLFPVGRIPADGFQGRPRQIFQHARRGNGNARNHRMGASVTHLIPRGDSPAGVWRLHGTLKGKFRSQRVEGAGNWLRSVEGCDLDPPGQPLVDAGCRRRLYLFIGPRRQERPTELI